MTQHAKDNQTKQLQENIFALSALTGIAIYLKENAVNTPLCSFCKQCSVSVSKLLNTADAQSGGCIFFCPKGFCRILSAISFNPELYLISEPIICGFPNGDLHTYISSQLQAELSSGLFLSPTKILQLAQLTSVLANPTQKTSLSSISYQNFYFLLQNAIQKEDVVLAQQTIDHILEEILENTGLDFTKTKLSCIKIILMIKEIAEKNGTFPCDSKENKFQMSSLLKADTIGELKDCLLCAGEDFIHTVFQASSIKKNTVIKQALEFVEKNYMKKINQNSVSQAVYLSSSYFSKLFKDITGYNFTEYLNQIRIQKAKELLEQDSVSIDEIPTAVGFLNRSYFGKVFRQITGITPKHYRDSFLER